MHFLRIKQSEDACEYAIVTLITIHFIEFYVLSVEMLPPSLIVKENPFIVLYLEL